MFKEIEFDQSFAEILEGSCWQSVQIIETSNVGGLSLDIHRRVKE